jgi:hypothetical protein
MKGDISRITFDPSNRFSSVLLQQGRVTLDADPNEQASILLHYLRTLAKDLIGPYGGPEDNCGFELTVTNAANAAKLTIGAGRYYVDGILCESEGCDYANQPDYTPPAPSSDGKDGDALLAHLQRSNQSGQTFLVYLDVWERLITWIEDDRIREVALGGPDTCVRSKVVWQVKATTVDDVVATVRRQLAAIEEQLKNTQEGPEQVALKARAKDLAREITQLSHLPCTVPLDTFSAPGQAQMAARLDPGQEIQDPCVISPSAVYRGAENQLYRVEIQLGGALNERPSFKWSRDNGSVATRWLGTDGNDLLVTSARKFAAGNWVELCDDSLDLQGVPGMLVKLAKVQNDRLTVDPDSIPKDHSLAWTPTLSNPKVRRWDQTENDNITLVDGAVPIVKGTATDPSWIDLEDSIQIQFAADGIYRSGDYWLIPARVATGTIDWPASTDGKTQFKLPMGITHHYAPLGILSWPDGHISIRQCRCSFRQNATCKEASTKKKA